MSKMKKVISLVLCIAMLAGTFTFLGGLIVPSASAAGETNVKTYAELDAAYDKFVYVGIDVVEVATGELTDGYVQPGDWLEYRMTVLSDMYVGASYPHIVYEKSFFDVRVVTSTTPRDHDNYGNNDYEANLKFEDGKLMNPDHPYAAPNQPTYHTLTALPASKIATQMGFCEVDAETYANWDLVKSNVGITTTQWNSNFPMTADAWWTCWYVRVKTGLANGTKGNSFSPESIWQHNLHPDTGKGDTRRLCSVSTADKQGTAGSSQALALRYNVVQHVLLDDTYHTFEIGEGKPVEKKTVTFQYVNGTVIATGDYAEGDTVEVPAVDGLVTWTEATKAVELSESFTMGQKALTYVAVVDTDEFNVTINLNGGEYADDAVLPEGATVADGKLVVKAAFGEEIDLTALPVPEKEGFTGAWTPETVTVDSTRGANASITWTKATYNAKFYLDKEAYESDAAAVREMNFVYGNTIPFANVVVSKTDLKFAGWIDAATGELANPETIYADNMNFYADWTDYNASATIWGLDYATGEWKALATKKADAGTKITISEIKALVNEDNFGSAAIKYAWATLTSDRDGNRVSATEGYTMVEGAENNIYIQTNVVFAYNFATPVFDAEGFITEDFATEAKTIESTGTTSTINLPAPKGEYAGYKFVCWTDAEGNEYAAGTNVTLDFANGAEYTFEAKYEAVEYTIEFVINKDATYKQTVKVDGTFIVGDTFTLSEMTFVDAEGNETGLPEIDVENENQEFGPYDSLDGYKFAGWKSGAMASALEDRDITEEITLTPEVIDSLTYNEVITIRGVWEALYFEFVAYYADSFNAEGKPEYKAMEPVLIQTGASIADAIAAAEEFANQHLPEGKRLTKNWKTADGSARPNYMPADKLELYAYYVGQSLSIYLDYNYGTEDAPLTLEDTMILSGLYSAFLFDGVDVENDIPEGELAPIAQMIRMSGVSEGQRPGETYEVVGWNIFYVENEADVYNRDMWKEGISDIEGSTIAKYTLIFQVEWKAHKDFLFRVYNTGGDLRSAIDKKFNKYFWYNRNPVADKESAVPLNALPDRLIIIGFLPKFEFEGGFALSIEPLTISKAWLNPANWGALLEALFNGLSTGFGGAI